MTFKQLNFTFIWYYYCAYAAIISTLFHFQLRSWTKFIGIPLTIAIACFVYQKYLKDNNPVLDNKQQWISASLLATAHLLSKFIILFISIMAAQFDDLSWTSIFLSPKALFIYISTWLIHALLAFGILAWLGNHHLKNQE